MAPKKDKSNDTEDVLEQHIDEMMDPKLPDPTSKPADMPGAPEVPDIDIYKNSAITDAVASDTQDTPKSDEGSKAAIPEEKQASATSTAATIYHDDSIDSPAADPLVEDIVASESDELLAAHDAEVAKAFDSAPLTFRQKLRNLFRKWWDSKPARYGTIAVLAIGLVVAGTVPTSRYFMLNTAGVRVDASLKILDDTTDLPLKNVKVTLGDTSAKTNQDGKVKFSGLRLGTQDMVIEQLGFAKVSRPVTLGLGSNPLEDVELRAVGTQFTFKLTDFLSGKPVKSAEASSGDANARSDDKGLIVLTVGKIDSATIEVLVKARDYRTEKLIIDTASAKPVDVVMVSDKKEIFVSKQSGKYDLYKIDIDGKNKKLLLAGTGNERSHMSVVPHPTENIVAFVSSRDNKRNQDGYVLDTLSIVNVDDGSVLTLEHSEQISIIDWVKDKLVYTKTKAGTSAGNPERNQMMSYDYNTTSRLQLATANYFSSIVSAKGSIYYASTSHYYSHAQPFFAKVNPDNTGKQTLLNAQIWGIYRSSYDGLYLSGKDGWYSYNLGDKEAKKLATAPANSYETRFYLDAPDGKKALWTEVRDGKGVLLTYDAASKKDKTLTAKSGLSYPLRWLDDRTVIYRVATPGETASYAISLDGGEARKITDMTNTLGLGRWYGGH